MPTFIPALIGLLAFSLLPGVALLDRRRPFIEQLGTSVAISVALNSFLVMLLVLFKTYTLVIGWIWLTILLGVTLFIRQERDWIRSRFQVPALATAPQASTRLLVPVLAIVAYKSFALPFFAWDSIASWNRWALCPLWGCLSGAVRSRLCVLLLSDPLARRLEALHLLLGSGSPCLRCSHGSSGRVQLRGYRLFRYRSQRFLLSGSGPDPGSLFRFPSPGGPGSVAFHPEPGSSGRPGGRNCFPLQAAGSPGLRRAPARPGRPGGPVWPGSAPATLGTEWIGGPGRDCSLGSVQQRGPDGSAAPLCHDRNPWRRFQDRNSRRRGPGACGGYNGLQFIIHRCLCVPGRIRPFLYWIPEKRRGVRPGGCCPGRGSCLDGNRELRYESSHALSDCGCGSFAGRPRRDSRPCPQRESALLDRALSAGHLPSCLSDSTVCSGLSSRRGQSHGLATRKALDQSPPLTARHNKLRFLQPALADLTAWQAEHANLTGSIWTNPLLLAELDRAEVDSRSNWMGKLEWEGEVLWQRGDVLLVCDFDRDTPKLSYPVIDGLVGSSPSTWGPWVLAAEEKGVIQLQAKYESMKVYRIVADP